MTDSGTSLVRRGEVQIKTASLERVEAVRETLESRARVTVAMGPPGRSRRERCDLCVEP